MTTERRQYGQAIAAALLITWARAVEFITEPDGRFYFMKWYRLQVEHPSPK